MEDVGRDKVGDVGEGGCDDGKIPVIFGDVCGSLFSVYCDGDEEEGNGGIVEIRGTESWINWFRDRG